MAPAGESSCLHACMPATSQAAQRQRQRHQAGQPWPPPLQRARPNCRWLQQVPSRQELAAILVLCFGVGLATVSGTLRPQPGPLHVPSLLPPCTLRATP